ncbi:MAG: PKD domain-containing protein [Chitinophagaceae bacterium]|nr:PKD domain-containing protein [Chitinophagaceae bacterium]
MEAQWNTLSQNASDSERVIKSIHFYNSSEGYLSDELRLFHTSNSGVTKDTVFFSLIDDVPIDINVVTPRQVYATDRNHILVFGSIFSKKVILYTENAGVSWKSVFGYNWTNPDTSLLFDEGFVACDFPSVSTGYAIHRDMIVKTQDAGKSWTPVRIDPGSGFYLIDFISDLTGYVVTPSKILKTTDGGVSWLEITNIPSGISALNFYNTDIGYLSTQNGLIYKTGDGGINWQLKTRDGVNNLFTEKLHFVSETTGYAVSDAVFKTTDGGNSWEPMDGSVIPFEYFGFYRSMFWLNNNIGWAGGGRHYLIKTTNGGGNTLPRAYFDSDTSELVTTGNVKLYNYSAASNTFKWYRNNQIISTSYNASYAAIPRSRDTIMLVASNGSKMDTAMRVIDTRPAANRCIAGFTYIADTSTVKLVAVDSQWNYIKHYWDFGDGAKDSLKYNVTHQYSAKGSYTITHTIVNNVEGCILSEVKHIEITKLYKCEQQVTMQYQVDSVFKNKVVFRGSADNYGYFIKVKWNYGDGSAIDSSNLNTVHEYSNSGNYNVCLRIEFYDGCIKTDCKSVAIQLTPSCERDFHAGNFFAVSETGDGIIVTALPSENMASKKHTWVFDNLQRIISGYLPSIPKTYVPLIYKPDIFSLARNQKIYHLDSTVRKIRHIVEDSINHCTDSLEKSVPLIYPGDINGMPINFTWFADSFPGRIQLRASVHGGIGSQLYQTSWDFGDGSGQGGVSFNSGHHDYQSNGTFTACIIYKKAGEDLSRLYCRNVKVENYVPCTVSASFDMTTDSSDARKVRFTNNTSNQTEIQSIKWDFGDSSYSTELNPVHRYATEGTFIVRCEVIKNQYCKKSVGSVQKIGLNLSNDTTFCDSSQRVKADAGIARSYLWSPGGDTTRIKEIGIGVHSVIVDYGNYKAYDTIKIEYDSLPYLRWVPGDTTIFINDPVPPPPLVYAIIPGQPAQLIEPVETPGTVSRPSDFLFVRQWNGSGFPFCNKPKSGRHRIMLKDTTRPVITRKDSILMAFPPPYFTYNIQWYRNNLAISGANQQTLNTNNIEAVYKVVLKRSDSLILNSDDFVFRKDQISLLSDFYYHRNIYVNNCGQEFKFYALESYANTSASNSYLWNFGNGQTSILKNPSCNYSTPGIYNVKLIVSNSQGLKDSVNKIVNVKQWFKPNLGHDTTVCGASFALHSGISNGGLYNGLTYLWSTGATSKSIVVNQSGTYWVKVTQCNFSVYDTINIQFGSLPKPSFDRIGDTLKCVYNSSYNQFQWIKDNTVIAGATKNYYLPVSNALYQIQVTGNMGCKAISDPVNVTFNKAPVDIGGVASIRGSDSILISFSFNRNINLPNDYIIQLSDSTGNFNQPQSSEGVLTIDLDTISSNAETLSLKVLIPENLPCGRKYTIRVIATNPSDTTLPSSPFEIINIPPANIINASSINGLCPGDTIELKAPQINSYKYQWFRNNAQIPGAIQSTLRVVQDGAYYVKVSNGQGCDSASGSLQVSYKDIPAIPVVTQSGDSLISSFADAYQWYNGNVIIAGATNRYYKPLSNGVYKVRVTNTSGCSIFSVDFSYVFTAVRDLNLNGVKIKVFPVPSKGNLNIQFDNRPLKPVTIEIKDIYGRLIVARKNQEATIELNLGKLANGIYILHISDGKRKADRLIVIAK